jgi:flagellar hook-associated protein 3 FlgL
MNVQQRQVAKVQQQISSGIKVSTPAEDPAAAVRILDLERTVDTTAQYQSNVSTLRGRLNVEESALATSGGILDRAKELTIQALNAGTNANDRLAIKAEIDQLTQELAGVANTQNANGEYIFSGSLSSLPAFAIQPVTGEYVYQGGSQQRTLQIGPTRQVADGDLGFNIFENINSSSALADENGKRSVFKTLQALSEGLAATYTPSSGEITGDRFIPYGLDYANPPTTTQFTLTSGGTSVGIDLSGQTFADVGAVVTEINAQLGGLTTTDMQARANGNRIEFVSIATGSGANIHITTTSGTFLTVAGFVDGQSKAGVDLPLPPVQLLQNKLGDVLADLTSAQNVFLETRTSVGARLNALDDQEAQNDQFTLDTKTTLSDTRDLDYADAINRFQLQSSALQAAQQAFGKVKALSLFNYI